MNKVAIYARVSSEEQKLHGLSIAAQKQALRNHCKENKIAIIDEYIDEGVSAGAMTKRKEMQRLLKDCRSGKVKHILFTRLDRWFRHVDKYHVIQTELNQLGVTWQAIHEPIFETITSMGKANINFYLTTAQIEVDRASERIKAVIEYKESKGQALTGNMPLGYKIGPDKKPIIDDRTAPIAMFILTEYERIMSKRQMIDEIKKRFGADVSYIIVSEVLKNRRYTGYFRGNPDYFPKMISIAQFDKNQELLKMNVKKKQPKRGDWRIYLFTGLLKCNDCGSILIGNIGNTSIGYRCRNYRFNKACSNNKVTTESILEKNMLARIKGDIVNIKLQAEKRAKDREKEAGIDVDAIREEMKRLGVMYRKRRIDEDEYEAEYEALEAQLELAAETGPTPSMDLVMLPEFDELYESFDRKERRSFWRGIIKYITAKGREIDPHFLA